MSQEAAIKVGFVFVKELLIIFTRYNIHIQGVPEFMVQTLRVGKIHIRRHFSYSNMRSETKILGS